MDRTAFFNAVRPLMPAHRLTREQVTRIDAVLDGLEQRRVSLPRAGYILGTAHHESDHWRTMEEYASGAAYEGRKTLGNTKAGDGRRFKGRGLVQITGRRNYTDWSKRLGVDLVGKPELAETLRYAVPILIDGMLLGTFTGKSLEDYISKHAVDYVNARRVVNGTDKASSIASRAKKYETALRNAGYGTGSPKTKPVTTPVATPKPQGKSFGQVLIAFFALIASKLFKR